MYDSLRRRPGVKRVAGAHARQTPAEAHQGSHKDFLRRHELEAAAAARGTSKQRRAFTRRLLRRAADARNIKCAIDYLIRNGEKAPGPNGIRLEQLSEHERWSLARTLGRMMRRGWRPRNRTRRVNIPKGSGNGTRPLDISDAEIKVAQRAIAQVIQPFLDPDFDEHSFGFRRHRGREQALATADLIMNGTDNPVVILADIKNAFTAVPRNRLTDVMRHQGLPEALIQLINALLGPQHRGLPQGGPLSPLLLNIYLDHVLDRPWKQRHPEIPLLRYADDRAPGNVCAR